MEESIDKTRIFYQSDYFKDVKPVAMALPVLKVVKRYCFLFKALKTRFELVVVTSRQET